VCVGNAVVAVDSAFVVKVAVPPVVNVTELIVVVPSMNVTVPVGLPEPGGFTVTFAVNVTG
jgi:hypothetical protein